ncbi:MAG: response regulator [Acidobacteriota bacterium]
MKKIIVVDDQPVLASVYRAKFVAEGFHVDVAADGEAALELIERVKPDLVLLDLMLPKIKGIDVLKKLRANQSFKTLPVIVFSGSGQSGAVEEAWAAGASMVLAKSKTSPKQMVESVHNALATSTPAQIAPIPAAPWVPARNGKSSLPAGMKKKILLVEINPETRAMLSTVLTQADYQISLADGHGHALLLIEIAHFDQVLINRALCSESYSSFCQQLRRQHADLPVVMYSINASPSEVKEALAHGISRYLTTAEELLDIAEISNMLLTQVPAAA